MKRAKVTPMVGREPYLSAAQTLLNESGCVVSKWRESTTGNADIYHPEWKIEVPEPRGPVSYVTLAHEVAHQMLHRPERRVRIVQRWEEELEAWLWALATFERFNLPGVEMARRDCATCMGYSISKALRRLRTVEKKDTFARKVVRALPEWLLDVLAPLDGDERSTVLSWSFECVIALAREREEVRA